MKLCFVSTINQKLYDEYGKRFIKEFMEKSEQNIHLHIYFEGDVPDNLQTKYKKNFTIQVLNNPRHQNFLKFYKNLFEAHGVKVKLISQDNGEKKVDLTSDYRFNAIKFSHKPFAIYQSILDISSQFDYIIWIDADLRCKKKFTFDNIKPFLPSKDENLSILQRKHDHSECGFLGFNIQQPLTIKFINRVINIYSTGEIFSLEEWHDSFVFDHVIQEFKKENIKIKNISGRGFATDHPFIHSGLEEFFDHLKGPERKKKGTSF
tara:strand:+ start:1088 stop:1876 length:789 start_codon:yes stop_codon:yes gene_type:complete